MIKAILFFYLLSLCIGTIVAIFTFFIDVIKWHFTEKKTVVIPSNTNNESEVFNSGRDNASSNRDNNGADSGIINNNLSTDNYNSDRDNNGGFF